MKRKLTPSPSRQGIKWSKYRCLCLATQPVFCVCGCPPRERVTWKGLEQRNLGRLFSPDSPERIHVSVFNKFRNSIFTGI